MVESTKTLERVTLEMSLKPFKSMDPTEIEKVCTEAIRQWLPLVDMSKKASILLWISDGSEILVWDGNLDTEIEWARYIGFANEWTFSHIEDDDDPRKAILYNEDPARITYGDLKNIIAIFKRVATEKYGLDLEVGATFDAGPEFAYSDFKYKDHPEINRAELAGEYISLKADYTVVCTWSKLKEDQASYAAYPKGIPDGTPFGEFFGKQCASFLPALDFDYIWFSNGFALSYFPWTYLGANYDGSNMPLVNDGELSEKIISFWDLFKKECPDYPTEIRGTNFGTAMDLAKDFIPFRDLYEKEYLEYPPPNSPWGALNYDFGLEIAGYMSRIAHLPGSKYPFRYYPNDPWFWQNPWTDLYDREPHDIYCPLSVARVNEVGEVEPPQLVEILTIDTEKGFLDEEVAMEVIPHIRRAYKDFPDKPGILTWLYPFNELHDLMEEDTQHTSTVFYNDWFMRNAINEGLPVNTVISTDNYKVLNENNDRALNESILITSAFWLKDEEANRIVDSVMNGGKVLLYGAVENEVILDFLNLTKTNGLEGECNLTLDFELDEIKNLNPGSLVIDHRSDISDGSLQEVLSEENDIHTKVRATVSQNGVERIFALTRSHDSWNGGTISWVRGSLPYKEAGVTNLPIRQEYDYFDSSIIMRYLLQDFGYTILQSKEGIDTASALLFIGRQNNGFWFTGCKQDTSVNLQFRFPEGVPLLTGQTTNVTEGPVNYSLNKTFHNECRIFVDQLNTSHVTCRELAPFPTAKKRSVRNISVNNLDHAKLTIYPPLAALEKNIVEIKTKDGFIDISNLIRKDKIVIENVSGILEVSW